ncbi:MAG: MBL fold metallo-hydrolase [Nanoarchaeota archaeon]
MTKITFVGTGEAFDPNRANTSYLIENKGKSIMIDCGYDSAKSLMRYLSNSKKSLVEYPSALLLTHEHGDHTSGIPALLVSIWEEVNGVVGNCRIGNKRKLEILSSNLELLEKIPYDVERYYSGFWDRFEIEGPQISKRKINLSGDEIYKFKIKSAQTNHIAVNFAYKFETPFGKSFAVSGDGALNDSTKELFRSVNFLFHEGFNILGSRGKDHSSIEQVLDYAVQSGIPTVGIVHVNRQERAKTNEINQLIEKAKFAGINLFLPNDHQSIEI